MKGQENSISSYENIDKKSVQAFNKQIKLLQLHYPKQFSLCLNLSCGVNNSIQKPLQIPPQMLSKSIEFMPKKMMQLPGISQQFYSTENRNGLQNNLKQSRVKKENKKQTLKQQQNYEQFMLMKDQSPDSEHHEQQLNIMQLNRLNQANKSEVNKKNTKNVLRNFGNAQNQFILYHSQGKKIINQHLQKNMEQQFYSWIHKIRLINFRDYRSVWAESAKDQKNIKYFKMMYRRLCWEFYQNYCIPYIFSGRMNSKNRYAHLKEINSMMKGLTAPEDFCNFNAQN